MGDGGELIEEIEQLTKVGFLRHSCLRLKSQLLARGYSGVKAVRPTARIRGP